MNALESAFCCFVDSNNTENNYRPHFHFGFKTDENYLYGMVRSIEFTQSCNVFQSQLATDIKQIKGTDFVLVSADKIANMYKMSVQNYNKILRENVIKSYKKVAN